LSHTKCQGTGDPVHAMNGGGMGVYCHIFINLVLKVNGQLHPSHFTPITHSTEGRVGPQPV